MAGVELIDVSARDGLQNEARLFTTDEKLTLIQKSLDAGFRRLEVASFVHPKHVPQMADAEAVIAALPDRADVTYIGLVMNMRGVERALETKVDELGCVCVATDTFAGKNQGQTSWGSVEVCKDMIRRALQEGRAANVTIGAAFGCPFEGEVSIQHVVEMAEVLAEVGPREISLADTIGVGNPWQTRDLFMAVAAAVPGVSLRGHFHNTRNTGLSNAYAALEAGAQTLDASIGGIGGCPFAPDATGNVPAEDVIYMLERGGIQTNLSLPSVVSTAQWLTEKMGRVLPGMVSRSAGFPAA